MTKFNLSKNEVNILTQIMRMPLHYDVNIEELTIKEINIPNKEMKFIKGFTKEDVKEFIKRLKEPIQSELEVTRKFNTPTSNTAIILLMGVINNIDKLAGKDLI